MLRKKIQSLITKDVYDFTMKNIDIIEKSIDHSRDFRYDYFGFRTLQKVIFYHLIVNFLLKLHNICLCVYVLVSLVNIRLILIESN